MVKDAGLKAGPPQRIRCCPDRTQRPRRGVTTKRTNRAGWRPQCAAWPAPDLAYLCKQRIRAKPGTSRWHGQCAPRRAPARQGAQARPPCASLNLPSWDSTSRRIKFERERQMSCRRGGIRRGGPLRASRLLLGAHLPPRWLSLRRNQRTRQGTDGGRPLGDLGAFGGVWEKLPTGLLACNLRQRFHND